MILGRFVVASIVIVRCSFSWFDNFYATIDFWLIIFFHVLVFYIFFYFKRLFNKAATCVNLTKNVHQCAKSDNSLTSLSVQQVELELSSKFSLFCCCLFFAELRSPFTFSPSFTRTHTKPPHLLKSGCTAKKMLIQSTGGSLKRLTLSEALKTLAHTYAQAISHAWQRLGFVATFMSVCLSVYVCLPVFLCLFACDPPT